MVSPDDTSLCPLCGQPNQCAVAADPDAKSCWCELVEFPKELLDQIPEDAVRKRCVCQNCLREFLESNGGSDLGSDAEKMG